MRSIFKFSAKKVITVVLVVLLSIQLQSLATVNISSIQATEDTVIRGNDTSDHLGGSIFGLGDLNKDGYDDLLVGDDKNLGAGEYVSYIIFGRPSLSNYTDRTLIRNTDAISINADVREAENLGDINGDGYNDLALSFEFSFEDEVRIFFGKESWDQNIDILDANITMDSFHTSYNSLGNSIESLGDINGDAIDDFMIAAPGQPSLYTSTGEVYVFYGNTTWPTRITNPNTADAIFHASTSSKYLGTSIANLGDINNDNYTDIAMTRGDDSSTTDTVHIFFGSSSGWTGNISISTANVIYTDTTRGIKSITAGDLNADGINDLVLYRSGVINVWFGKTIWPSTMVMGDRDSYLYLVNQNNFGSVQGNFDFDGDGIGDLEILGLDGNYYVFPGRASWSTLHNLKLSAYFLSPTREFRVGTQTYKHVGDFDGNGQQDIIYGNPSATYENSGDIGNIRFLLNPDPSAMVFPPTFVPPIYLPPLPSVQTTHILDFQYSDPSSGAYTILKSPDQYGIAGAYSSKMFLFDENGTYQNFVDEFANTPIVSSDFGNIKIVRDMSGKMVMWNTTETISKVDEYYVPISLSWDGVALASNYEMNWLAFNDRDLNITVIDFDSKERVINWTGPDPDDKIIDLALTPHYLIVLSQPTDYLSSLYVINMTTAELIYNHTSRIEFKSVETMVDGRAILGDYDGSLYLFHPNSTVCGIEQLTMGDGRYPNIKANPQYPYVAYINQGNNPKIYVPDTGEIFDISRSDPDRGIYPSYSSVLDWDSQGDHLAISHFSGGYNASIWEVDFTHPEPRPSCLIDTSNSSDESSDTSTSDTTSDTSDTSESANDTSDTGDKTSETDPSNTPSLDLPLSNSAFISLIGMALIYQVILMRRKR